MDELKILLVDDEKEFVDTLAERLLLRGVAAETATSGEEAIALIKESPPDIVILDLMMPGLGGLEILKQIKADDPDIQVILLTGRASTEEAVEGMRHGAFDYLMKPLTIEELIKKASQALNRVGKPQLNK